MDFMESAANGFDGHRSGENLGLDRWNTFLVGGLEHQFYFPIYWVYVIIPIDELIFFGGVALAHQPDEWWFSRM